MSSPATSAGTLFSYTLSTTADSTAHIAQRG
jgi:hypothetical protein